MQEEEVEEVRRGGEKDRAEVSDHGCTSTNCWIIPNFSLLENTSLFQSTVYARHEHQR